MSYPSLDLERELLGKFQMVIGIDEVGRGALAGPVAVGAFGLDAAGLSSMPTDLRDSKLVTEKRRAPLAFEVSKWGKPSVGFAGVDVIEARGINFALQRAALNALENFDLTGAIVLLDGSHNWLGDIGIEVRVIVKADRDCGSVAGGAISAKVKRDALMIELGNEFPTYGWQGNKGYSSPSHIAALRQVGPSAHHRLSWLTKILADDSLLF
jgi:ribonuclease HII